MASCCAESCFLALFAFSAVPGLEALASPSSFSPCPCTLGHRFPCTAQRCEAGGSFLPVPEVSAAVTENGNNSTGFPLLFILPLNSAQPPHFPCATRSNTPPRSLSRAVVHPPPRRHDVNQGLTQGTCFPLITAWPPNTPHFPSSFRARLCSDALNPQPLNPAATSQLCSCCCAVRRNRNQPG